MVLSSFDMQGVEKQFDFYCKVVIFRKALDIIKHNKYLAQHEKSLHNLTQDEENKIAVTNSYKVLLYKISVFNLSIYIDNEALYKSLLKLKSRDIYIIILKYWYNFTDNEISIFLKIPRTTVTNARLNSLKKMKKDIQRYY